MVSNISIAQPQPVNPQTPKPSPKPAASQSQAPSLAPNDSVQLSAAAQKAISGDVDHDGDSH
jgi:hypothetical protein